MRKIFFIIFFLPTILYAQHLKFMGIPIDGDINTFGKQLEAKGFKVDKTDGEVMFLTGKFTGEDVSVGILSSVESKKVCRIVVFFDKETSWSSLKTHYTRLKENYSAKYEVEKDYHFFIDPYYEGDGYEMSAVRNDKCRYSVFYKAEFGSIHLQINKIGCISVAYEDNLNVKKLESERESKIQDDI